MCACVAANASVLGAFAVFFEHLLREMTRSRTAGSRGGGWISQPVAVRTGKEKSKCCG